MRYIALAALLVLAGCASAPPSVQPPAHVYVAPTTPLWKLTPGSWTEYQTSTGTGVYDPATGMIQRNNDFVAGGVTRVTCLPYTMPEGPAIARVYSGQGVAVTTVPAGLMGTLIESNDGHFIGEAANVGASDQSPPEPLITVTPVSGETFYTASRITWAGGGTLENFPTMYWTIATDVTIDGFTHATVTALTEYPGVAGKETAYLQVFDGGTDIAEIWFGPVAGDNTVQVTMAKRVLTGVNP